MYRPMANKKEQFVKDIAEAVEGVIKDPVYSALTIGGDTKQTVIEHISTQLDGKIAEGKEKAVDRILDHVRRTLLDSPQFEYHHDKDGGEIAFSYTQKQETNDCKLCNGTGKTNVHRAHFANEIVTCPDCCGTGNKKEWEF